MDITTMDGGRRSKVDIRLRLKDGGLGKPLLGKQKVDIRISDAEKHQAKIQAVPLRNTCAQITTKSLLEEFEESFGVLDLKTAWLIVRQYSPAVRRDDDIAMVLFCENCADMANLTFSVKFELMERSLKQVLGKERIGQKYWLFLKKLANEASRLKYLRNNPLADEPGDTIVVTIRNADEQEMTGEIRLVESWRDPPEEGYNYPINVQRFYHELYAPAAKMLLESFPGLYDGIAPWRECEKS